MKTTEVLLRENVDNLGMIGDVVRVAPGYARNFLVPRRLAVEATAENIKSMERRRARYEVEVRVREAEMAGKLEALGNLRLVTVEKADESGTLYGSVSAAAIARLLARAGHSIDERNVRLEEPIKTVGVHEVPVHVYGEHYAGIQVVVESEG
jgi:large subunit ribosomal protein L9